MEELQRQQRLEDERQREKQREELRRKKDLVRATLISSNSTIIGANERVIIINSHSKKPTITLHRTCHLYSVKLT